MWGAGTDNENNLIKFKMSYLGSNKKNVLEQRHHHGEDFTTTIRAGFGKLPHNAAILPVPNIGFLCFTGMGKYPTL